MVLTDRREFLKRAGYSVAGLTALSGPLQGIFARGALAVGSTGVAANNGGYGPLVPVADETDGVVRLHLPEGFEYRSFTPTGTPLDDGGARPAATTAWPPSTPAPSRYRLVRNHEVNGPVGAFGDRSKAYDPVAGGGTTTFRSSARTEEVDSWVSCNGTQMNCAGGAHAVGHLAHVRGDGERPRRRQRLHRRQQHLAHEEARLRLRGTGLDAGSATPVPIRSAGRFAHEAVDVDPVGGSST